MKRYLPVLIFFLAVFGILLFLTYYEPPRRDVLDESIWKVTDLNKSPMVEGTTLTIRFHDGVVRGSSGCNTYEGVYDLDKNKIAIGKLKLTTDNCMKPGIMEQEREFTNFLMQAATFSITANQLTITKGDGGQVILISMLE